MKVLLTDDSRFMRTILKAMLEKVIPGIEYFEAGTGVEAVKLWHQHHPDLMLLDLVMPDKDGISVLRELKPGSGTGKVVVISALGQEGVMSEAKSLGASDFIVKPFDEKRVIETVKKVLGI